MKSAKDLIITLPNDNLRKKSQVVETSDNQVKSVIEHMKQATIDWEKSREFEVGVALAAIQIDQPYRIIIIRQDFEEKKNQDFTVLINPEIIKLDGKIIDDYEGCLSVKDVYGKIPRYEKIRIKAIDENGNKVKFSAKGFLARVLQHEIDHLNGKLFIDHIKNNKKAFYKLGPEGQLVELEWDKDVKELGLFR